MVVLGLGAYTYSFYNEIKENKNELLKDKALIQEELDEEIVRYGKLLQEKNQMSSELSQAKERLEALQKKIDSNEITRSIVRQYQEELRQLRKESGLLFKQNDSLQQETRRLSDLQERTQNSLDSITKERKEAPVPRESVNEIKDFDSPRISLSNIQAQGVIQRNSGKFVNTSRAGRAQMVRLCYVLDENKELPAAKMTFYVKVLNSSNNLIGIERSVILDSGEKLSYNTETSVQYQNESHKICELVLPIQSFGKGDYSIAIYDKYGLLETTSLTLK
jgi:myosin heavy subunit